MPQLLAFLACENVIIGQDSNISLIEVLNGVTAAVSVPVEQLSPDAGAPHKWFVVAIWHKMPEEQDADFEQRITLVDPSGKTRIEAFSEVAFRAQKPTYRIIGEMSGFPVNPPGVYMLQLYIRKPGDEVWSEKPVSSYPLAIKVKKEEPAVSKPTSVNTEQLERNSL